MSPYYDAAADREYDEEQQYAMFLARDRGHRDGRTLLRLNITNYGRQDLRTGGIDYIAKFLGDFDSDHYRSVVCTALVHEILVGIKPDWTEYIPYLRRLVLRKLSDDENDENNETMERIRVMAITLLGRMRATQAIGELSELCKTCNPDFPAHVAAKRVLSQLVERSNGDIAPLAEPA